MNFRFVFFAVIISLRFIEACNEANIRCRCDALKKIICGLEIWGGGSWGLSCGVVGVKLGSENLLKLLVVLEILRIIFEDSCEV